MFRIWREWIPLGWSSEAFAMPALSAAGFLMDLYLCHAPKKSPHLIRFTSFHPKLDRSFCVVLILTALVAVCPDLQFLVRSWNWCFSTYSLNIFFFSVVKDPREFFMRHKVWVESRLASKVPLDFFSYIEVPEGQSRVGRWFVDTAVDRCGPLWLKILPPNNCFGWGWNGPYAGRSVFTVGLEHLFPWGLQAFFLGDEYGLVLLSLFLPSIIIFSRYSLIWFPRKSTVLATEIEAICIVIFTLEYSLRLLGCNRAAGHGHVETCWKTAPCFGALREFLALLI